MILRITTSALLVLVSAGSVSAALAQSNTVYNGQVYTASPGYGATSSAGPEDGQGQRCKRPPPPPRDGRGPPGGDDGHPPPPPDDDRGPPPGDGQRWHHPPHGCPPP
ncbi:hypothetical protein, partial [Asaia bogorensis]|uniref:hypothetical protein n=1 Tax=Asaia bogorensis TaxID=91915 RepID=UPI000EFCB247